MLRLPDNFNPNYRVIDPESPLYDNPNDLAYAGIFHFINFKKAWRSVTRAVSNVVNTVVGNVSRGINDVVQGIDRGIADVRGRTAEVAAIKEAGRLENEARLAQQEYNRVAKEQEEQLAKQRVLMAEATTAQEAAEADALRIEAETAEQTRIAQLESKRITQSNKIQTTIDAARARQQQQAAEAAALQAEPEVEDDVSRPTITRTPISTPVPGGYGGTDPGSINPTGLNI